MDMIPVESSQIKAIGCDPDMEIMHIKFSSGAVWEYLNVNKEFYDAFMKSESKGKFFHRSVKAQFCARKLFDPREFEHDLTV